jgi:hypothetical protein
MPDPRNVTFTTEMFLGHKNGYVDAFDEYGRKPWHDDYKDNKQKDIEWHTFQAFKGEFARKFGPYRRGVVINAGGKEKIVDDEEYHTSNLRLEQFHKAYFKKPRNKKRKKSKKRK